MPAFKLARKEISEPSLDQRDDTAQKEEPDTPARGPEAYTRPFADRTCVKAVVDEMLEVLGHANLPHEPVLVPVHPRQLADMGEDVVKTVSKLEGLYVAEAVLDVGVHD